MEEFLNKLYSYEYFGTYLMISIVVLLLIFVIILFFGKKDQKNREIEATKKLQRISSEDAFKEESSLQSVEVKKDENTVPLDDTIIVPNINNVPPISNPEPTELSTQTPDNTPINFDNQVEKEKPMESQNIPNEVEVPNNINEEFNINTDVTPNITLTEAKEEPIGPVLEKEEEKPFVFASNETTPIINDNHSEEIYPFVNNSFENPKIEDVKVEEDNNEETIRVPQFNFDEIINSSESIKEEVETPKPEIQRGPQIFSSVYAPKQEDVEAKEEVKVPSSDELDIELPILKSSIEKNKEEKIEPPVLQDYNLDSISGETYDIK